MDGIDRPMGEIRNLNNILFSMLDAANNRDVTGVRLANQEFTSAFMNLFPIVPESEFRADPLRMSYDQVRNQIINSVDELLRDPNVRKDCYYKARDYLAALLEQYEPQFGH